MFDTLLESRLQPVALNAWFDRLTLAPGTNHKVQVGLSSRGNPAFTRVNQ
jgi:hypothetical protein